MCLLRGYPLPGWGVVFHKTRLTLRSLYAWIVNEPTPCPNCLMPVPRRHLKAHLKAKL